MSSCKIKSLKAWLMTAMLLVTLAISGNAIRIHAESDTSQELNLVDLKIIPGLYHGEPSTEHTVGENKYSIHWDDHTTNTQLLIGYDEGSMPNNWSKYDYLEIEIYSEAATGEMIVPSVWTRAEGTNYYFWNLIEVNWTGSKTIQLKLDETAGSSGSPTWENISYLSLRTDGWKGSKAVEETDLYISDIKLVKEATPNEVDLVNFNDSNICTQQADKTYTVEDGTLSTDHVADGNTYSVHWNNHTTNTQLLIGYDEGSMPNNWSEYDCLELEIYSEAATGEMIVPSVWTRAEGTNYYFWNHIVVDWTGSKIIQLKLDETAATQNGSPTWENISYISLRTDSWRGSTAVEGTELYISEIKLVKETENEELELVDLNKVSIHGLDKGEPSTEHSADVNLYSINWNNHTTNTQLLIGYDEGSMPNNWSEYDCLELEIYSEAATGEMIVPSVWTRAEGTNYYFWDLIEVNWIGSKTITLNLDEIAGSSGNPTWENISYISFRTDGWKNSTAVEGTNLYISEVKLVKETESDTPSGGDTPSELELVDFNLENIPGLYDGTTSTEHAAEGKTYSINWINHTTKTQLLIGFDEGSMPNNWSEYDCLELEIYSEAATGEKIVPSVWTRTAGTNYYFWDLIEVNWTGSKTIKLRFNTIAGSSGSPTWENISYISFRTDGWKGSKAVEGTNLYISGAKLVKEEEGSYSYDFLTSFYDAETLAEANAKLNGNVAVYAGGSNVVKSVTVDTLANVVKPDSVDIVSYCFGWKDSKVTVPVSLFKDYFGATVTENGDTYTIVLGDVTVSGTVGEKKATVNGTETDIELAAYKEADMTWVSSAEIAELLGLYSECDGKLLVLGTSDTVEAFGRVANLGVNELGEIVAYLAYHDEVDPSTFTVDDCKAVKKNWVRAVVGDESTNDLTDPDIQARIQTIDANARASRAMLIKDEGATEIFTGITSTASADITTAYTQVYNMALAYATSGSVYEGDEALFADIKFALDWLNENRYNKEIYLGLSSAPWKVTGSNNWWDWAIGVPAKLVTTLMMVEDKLTPDEISGYLAFYDEHVPVPRMTGANFTDMAYDVIGSALLQNDPQRVLVVQGMLTKSFLYSDDNERFAESALSEERLEHVRIMGAGFFTDGSYILHSLHPQNYSYGQVQFVGWADFISIFADTRFEMKHPFIENVYDIFKNNFDSVVYDGKVFRWTLGRGTSQSAEKYYTVHANAFRIASTFDEEEQIELYQILKEAGQKDQAAIVEKLPIDCIKSFKELLADDSVAAKQAQTSNQVFYNVDKVVHKTPNWGLAVAMSSSRIFNYESILNLNIDGWYLSDGRTEYYVNGSSANASWGGWLSLDKYRLPGTTVDTQQRKAVSISQGNEYLSSKDFVGGVTLGDYGVAAMDLESYHNAEDFGWTLGDGGPAPAHQNDLTAKKAYFMFDDEVVCLGTDVNASNNNNAEVLTIVENLAANKISAISEDEGTGEPYEIIGAYANKIPESANTPENTIDGSYTTKYAGDTGAEIWWDLGSVKTVGFIDLSFQNGAIRKQYFDLAVSIDGENWTVVFDGESSGMKEVNEFFDLKNSEARYVKYINEGNSQGREWVSLTNCMIYPPNADGSIGIVYPDVYGADEIVADGKAIKIQGLGDVDVSDVSWMNAADTCGYVFPRENTENMGKLYTRWTRGNQSCFELWFSHGTNPENGGYAYILLPGQSAEETAAYAADTNIRILANNNQVQAVRDTELGITGIVFWEAGSFEDVTVDKPCMVVYRKNDAGQLEIAVSDPTQKLNSLTVTVNGKVIGICDTDECIAVNREAEKLTLSCNMDGSVGRSMLVSLAVEKTPEADSGEDNGSQNGANSDDRDASDGNANNAVQEPEEIKSPQTGEDGGWGMWMALLLICLSGAVAFGRKKDFS